MSNRISQHQPKYEKGIFEFKEIARVEEDELTAGYAQKERILLNQFVLTADESGVQMFEKLYGIVPAGGDTLDFRKERILSRIQLQPPYTERFLRAQLDKLIGAGTYDLIIDYNDYIIYINYQAPSESIEKEVSIVVSKIKPANMVYVTEPLLIYGLLENEVISSTPTIYYKLGTRWILGKYPFKFYGEEEVFKLANVNSITSSLLEDTANFIMNETNKVILNGSIEINTFTVKRVSNNVFELEYEVSPNLGISNITRIQLCKSDGTALTDVVVYVPILDETLVNHKIQVKEGV